MDYEPILRELVKAIDGGNQSAIDEVMLQARQNLGLDNRRRILKLLDAALEATSNGETLTPVARERLRRDLGEVRGFIKSLLPESKLRTLLTAGDIEVVHNCKRIGSAVPWAIREKLKNKGSIVDELCVEASTTGYLRIRGESGSSAAWEYVGRREYAAELSEILKDAEK